MCIYTLQAIDITQQQEEYFYRILKTSENNRQLYLCDKDGKRIDACADFTLIDDWYKYDVYIDDMSYRKKGIPEALILKGKMHFKKEIKSLKEGRHSWSTKHWERLVIIGKAIKLENEDYVTL